jgi:hypothetical protein
MGRRICHTAKYVKSLIRAVKDEKLPKMMKRTTLILWLLAQPLVRKSTGTTFNAAYTKMALARSQLIFKPKMPKLFSQDGFCNATMTPLALPLQVSTSNGGKVFKIVRQPPYLPNIATEEFFSLWENEVGVHWHLPVPGQFQDEPAKGHLNHRQRQLS